MRRVWTLSETDKTAPCGTLRRQMSPRPSGNAKTSQGPAQRQRWRLGLGELAWRAEDRSYASLLEALTRESGRVLRQTQELVAPAVLTRGGISADLERSARAELAMFRAAMEDARKLSGQDDQAELSYDSRNPEQDAWADILIQYLVRTGYAEVRTEEPEPWHYSGLGVWTALCSVHMQLSCAWIPSGGGAAG
jgi:hypothetical protein